MLDNPHVRSQMNEMLNNPTMVEHMINSNPMFRNMPGARELIQSPMFREMMTNPDMIRQAARMQQSMGMGGLGGMGGMGGEQGAGGFPAPGVTDQTTGGSTGGETRDANSTGTTTGSTNPVNPFAGLQGLGGMPGMNANPFASLFNNTAAGTGTTPAQTPPTTTSTGNSAQPTPNPFGDLLNNPLLSAMRNAQNPTGAPGTNPPGLFAMPPSTDRLEQMMRSIQSAQATAGTSGTQPADQNPFGMPPGMDIGRLQQMMQMFGGMDGLGAGGVPAAPADTRPPEERYADQLRQLNDMGFFDFDRNIAALRRSGGSVQGAIEHLLG